MTYKNPFTRQQALARYGFADRQLPKGYIADLGCNSGLGLKVLQRAGRAVIGYDVNPRFCSTDSDIHHRDILTQPLPPKSNQGITLLEVLEHLPQSTHFHVIHAIAEALTPDGVLVISTPNKGAIPFLDHGHIGEVDLDTFKSLLEAHFAQVEIFGFGRVNLNLEAQFALALRTKLCKWGVYPFLHALLPGKVLGYFSSVLRSEDMDVVQLHLIPMHEKPLNFIAVAKQPRYD